MRSREYPILASNEKGRSTELKGFGKVVAGESQPPRREGGELGSQGAVSFLTANHRIPAPFLFFSPTEQDVFYRSLRSSSSSPTPSSRDQAPHPRFCDPSTLAKISRVSLAFLELSSPILYQDNEIVGHRKIEQLFSKRVSDSLV